MNFKIGDNINTPLGAGMIVNFEITDKEIYYTNEQPDHDMFRIGVKLEKPEN